MRGTENNGGGFPQELEAGLAGAALVSSRKEAVAYSSGTSGLSTESQKQEVPGDSNGQVAIVIM